MTDARFNELIHKWTEKTSSPEENAELWRFLSLKDSTAARRLFTEEIFARTKKDEPLQDKDAARIIAEITGARQRVHWITPTWVRYAAAVVAILLAAGYFYSFKQTKDLPVSAGPQYSQKGVPGGQRAVLTLGDGRTIILDSVADGQLAKQGAAEVTKSDHGSLSYVVQHDHGIDPSPVVYNTLSTPKGGQYQLQLPDGTTAWLNAASSISYPTVFTGNKRTVTIEGEVYLEVQANASMPFVVNVKNKQQIEVLGTRFNVNAYDNEPVTRTTLLEGRINIAFSGMRQQTDIGLKPGQQAQQGPANEVKVIDHADLDHAVSWRNGKFSFVSTDLETIMREIARWYDVEVVYKDRIADTYTATVSMKSPIADLLRFIEMSGGVHFQMNGNTITVTK